MKLEISKKNLKIKKNTKIPTLTPSLTQNTFFSKKIISNPLKAEF
jgi:hypothetical protein